MENNIAKAEQPPFFEVEKTIAEIERNWDNVVIRFSSKHECSTGFNKDKDDRKPKEYFADFVTVYFFGVVEIRLPDYDFEKATSILALAFDRDTLGLDKQRAIYKHNLSHPDQNIAWLTYSTLKRLKK